MYKVAMLTELTLALLLMACARADPVDEDAIEPPDNLVGDSAAEGLAAPANSEAFEAVKQAAIPPASGGGLVWNYNAKERTASFGPPGSPAFSIQCQLQREGQKQVQFVRFNRAPAGGKGTLSFTGNGQMASVPVAAVADPAGPGGHWLAVIASGDTARDVAETFTGSGSVDVEIGGVPPLVVPATGEPRRVLGECLQG